MDLLSPGLEPPPVTRFDIESAGERIAGHVRETPVVRLEPGALAAPGLLTLKLELLQHTGSFKPRGAFNRMLTADIDASGVLAASGGNFGLAVAYAARSLGHPAEIFVPATSPAMKIDRIRACGATVHVVDGYYADAYAACEERAWETGAAFLHPYDQPAVVAGQGTLAREFEEQIKWFGHAAFLVTSDQGTHIMMDPYEPGAFGGQLTYGAIKDQADIVLTSHDHAITIIPRSFLERLKS